MKQKTLVLIAALFVSLLCVAQTRAQAARTFVAVAGNDANNCTYSTPCRTFAGAVPNTASGGEITALNSGAYGVVTIDKALTLQAAPGAHVTLGDGTANSTVTINVSASSVVVLRNLHISRMGPILRGIDINSLGSLHIEGCVITGFASGNGYGGYGIRAMGACSGSGACLNLLIKDTIMRENDYGIWLSAATAVIDRGWIGNNTIGLMGNVSGGALIRDSVIAGNSDTGLFAIPGTIRVENCLVTRNGIGIYSVDLVYAGVVYVSNTMIVGNVTGLKTDNTPNPPGEIISFGNNRLAANTTNGAFTSTTPQQ